MNMSKRLLFDRNPLDDAYRAKLKDEASEYMSQFPFRIARRRRNRESGGYWDNKWWISLERAVKDIGLESIVVNDGQMFRSNTDREAALKLAEEIRADFESRVMKKRSS
jgi:hypothetical protein